MINYDEKPLVLNSYNKMLDVGIACAYGIFVMTILILVMYTEEPKLIISPKIVVYLCGIYLFGIILFKFSTKAKDKEKIVFKDRRIEFYENGILKKSLNLEIVKFYLKRPFFRQGFLKINFINSIFIMIIVILSLALNFNIVLYIIIDIFILNILHKFVIFKSFENGYFNLFPIILLSEPLEEVKKINNLDNNLVKSISAMNTIASIMDGNFDGGSSRTYYSNTRVDTKCFFVFIDSLETYNELKFYLLSKCNIDIEDIDKTFL